MATIQDLYKTLHQRKRPEDVAEMILNLGSQVLTASEVLVLKTAAVGSLKSNFWTYTSMLQEFAPVCGADKQIAKAIELFSLQNTQEIKAEEHERIEGFIRTVSFVIQKQFGANNFKENRLNKKQRKDAGLDLSKRNYNKKWRLLKRLERKLTTILRETKKREFQMISKHGLAHQIDFANFSADLNTAFFIAYYNARCNLRSTFSNQSQERPFDEICQMLLNRCKGEPAAFFNLFKKKDSDSANSTNWWAISFVYTGEGVLENLSNQQKGELLGRWTTILQDIALLLREVWNYSNINRETMVVKRGNDSTTWNNTAGAWNKARDNWMNLVYALGMDSILDEVCFGKVLRLMAADVVAWHLSTGGKLDTNTQVWNKLPLPWEVFEGKLECNKQMVERVCNTAGLDAEKSGWVAPRPHGIAKFKPTPELVHGVALSNPFLATVLKRHKYFSGKGYNPIFPEMN